MKRKLSILLSWMFASPSIIIAQCSVCTKTAEQLGEGPAKDLNGAIIYLAFMPLVIVAIIGYLWYRRGVRSEE